MRARTRYAAPPAAAVVAVDPFPFTLTAGERFVRNAQGTPTFLFSDAAYSLVAQLSAADMDYYFDHIQALGCNACIINVYEHLFGDQAPNNALGVAPFSTPEDLRTANTAYFAHVLTAIQKAKARNIACLTELLYYGADGTQQGWRDAILARTTAEMNTLGQLMGTWLGAEKNVIAVSRGDSNADAAVSRYQAFVSGFDTTSSVLHLHTAHVGDNNSDNNQTQFGVPPLEQQDLNICYVFAGTNSEQIFIDMGYSSTPVRPWMNYEQAYQWNAPSEAWQRTKMYKTLAYGGAMAGPGSEQRWPLGNPGLGIAPSNDWKASFSENVTQQYLYYSQFIAAWRCLEMVPDPSGSTALITAGRGTVDTDGFVGAGRTADHKQAILVLPAGTTSVTFAKSAMSTTFDYAWFNPRNGQYTTDGTTLGFVTGVTNSGSLVLTVPAGGLDWVVILRVP